MTMRRAGRVVGGAEEDTGQEIENGLNKHVLLLRSF